MSYIRAIVPMKGRRLFMDMESGSGVIVDLSVKLRTMKYRELEKEPLFLDVKTDGDYVIWGGGLVKVTVKELMEIVLYGEDVGPA
jgi:hypothetical protein